MITVKSPQRGQVLIIFVFAIIGLLAITGLAIDGVNLFSDRRHAQNAADTAALAAALSRNNWEKANQSSCNNFNTVTPLLPACSAPFINAALDLATENGYNNDLVSNTVDVYNPPKDGAYSDCTQTAFDCHDYIEVIIHSNVDTWFARVLGIDQLHNTVEAVALAHYSAQTALYGGNSLVQLGQGKGSCPSDFNVGGSGNVTLVGGGIYVNSANPDCAYKQTSCKASLVLQGGATVSVVGGADTGNCSSPPISKATTTYPFPPPHLLDVPPECSTAGTFTTSGTTTTYQPGSYYSYKSFPVNNDNAVLSPGVYCINDLNNLQNSNQSMSGTGVMVYLRPTGQVQITGSTVNISAPTGGTYAGYLIYQDWSSTSTVQNCTITGNGGSQYTGLIFVPYCDMTINGTSTNNGFTAQIIAYTISLSGTNNLYFTYNPSLMPYIPEQDKTGLYR